MFTEYGRLALEQSNEKPFQNLIFIIRDWQHQLETSYGWHGKEVSDEALSENSDQTDDMRELRQNIKSNFESISAFLMPYPGKMVAEGRFHGNMEDIEADFKEYLQILVPSLLAPENLVVKKINGEDVCARDLVQYLEEYIQIFTGTTLPEPKSVFMATAEVSSMLLTKAALQLYKVLMEESLKNVDSYVSLDDLQFTHLEAKERALDQFDEKVKIGGAQLISSKRNDLEGEINEMYKYYQERSENDRETFHLKAEAHDANLANELINYFNTKVSSASLLGNDKFEEVVEHSKQFALSQFDIKKMGDDAEIYHERMNVGFSNILLTLQKLNESKMKDRSHSSEGAAVGAIIGAAFGPIGAFVGSFIGAVLGQND